MKVRYKDCIWVSALLLIIFILVFPATHNAFLAATKAHPYIMGFVKVSILATMGEILALRIASGDYKRHKGLIYRFLIWGFIGMTFALVFDLFASGVTATINAKKGLLPYIHGDSFAAKLIIALLTSAFMNIIFAPTFMAFHRITDTYIDLGEGRLSQIVKVDLSSVVSRIDWYGFVSFVVLKTIPVFWIPAHTLTFMLPPEYRVLAAAFLSIALGGILAFAKKRTPKSQTKVH